MHCQEALPNGTFPVLMSYQLLFGLSVSNVAAPEPLGFETLQKQLRRTSDLSSQAFKSPSGPGTMLPDPLLSVGCFARSVNLASVGFTLQGWYLIRHGSVSTEQNIMIDMVCQGEGWAGSQKNSGMMTQRSQDQCHMRVLGIEHAFLFSSLLTGALQAYIRTPHCSLS